MSETRKLWGLIGAQRSGKDIVADFLVETRDFKKFAFADRIKQEAGISKEDFELAKLSGKIEEVRKYLWEFSGNKTKKDPYYFITPVMEEALLCDKAIITDIRKEEELDMFFSCSSVKSRIYCLSEPNGFVPIDPDTGFMLGSKIKEAVIKKMEDRGQLMKIVNNKNGLFAFLSQLEQFFFKEDVVDLFMGGQSDEKNIRMRIDQYLVNFNISGIKK